MSKIELCVVCGGRSAEHEVSLLSAMNVIAAVDRKRFSLRLVGIHKDGTWHLHDPDAFLSNADDPSRIALTAEGPAVALVCRDGCGQLVDLSGSGSAYDVEVVFPVLHGTYGEDGAIQGLLQMAGTACVGCGVAGSAVCMDKELAKNLLRHAEISVARDVVVNCHARNLFFTKEVLDSLGAPLFVKPARMGSSVGVSKCTNVAELHAALDAAFVYDTKVLVEETIEGREIECAVLGNDTPEASIPGEVVPQIDFYSYEAKYINDDGALLKAPAELDDDEIRRVQAVAVDAFGALDCRGMARVDMFLRPNGAIVVNEVNTIPGFTKISMYPRLWGLTGVPYPELVDRLVKLALEYHDRENALCTEFS